MLLLSRRPLALAAALSLSAAASAQLHLIPIPRSVSPKGDVSLTQGVTVVCEGCDADDQFAATDLRQTLAERHIPTGGGLRIVLQRLAQHPDATFTEPMRAEGYTIASTPGTLTLTGATAEGVFYAAQTAKQLIEGTAGSGFTLHQADIHDYPALKIRGLHDDLSRGPVDTLDFQKKLIRTLAAYKDNLYSPYFESTQQYAGNPLTHTPHGSISAADARELVAYARQYHVTVVPEQEAFGHLRHMLVWEKYADVAETPHGAVLAPGQPGSIPLIGSMFRELAALYPSPYLHVGGDETVDLGVGRTLPAVESRGLGTVYLDFMQRIVTELAPLHRKVLFWGDIAVNSPDLMKAMPQSFKDQAIAVAWGYSPNPKGFDHQILPFKNAGLEFWVAPSINNYRQVYPNQQQALEDIQQFTRDGQRLGATGQLNTLWNDDGESLATQNWYGILFGCAAAWQSGESPIPAYQNSFAQTFLGDTTGTLNQAQNELTAAMDMLHGIPVVRSSEGTDGLFWIDPWSKDGMAAAEQLRPVLAPIRLHAENAIALIAQARAANPSLREQEAIDGMDFGARRIDFLALKFQLADEMAAAYSRAFTASTASDRKLRRTVARELSDINGVNGRLQDLIYGYAQLRDLYEEQWNHTYRPYGLRPVLERYDYTIHLWYSRVDAVRNAQRQWNKPGISTLPSAADLGIPAPPPSASTKPVAGVLTD